MYPNLRAEMARKKISVSALARMIGAKGTTMSDKYHGRSRMTLEDAIAIKDALGVEMPLEILFKKE